MVTSSVDTDVLLDILIQTSAHYSVARKALKIAASEGPVIVSTITYAEISGNFPAQWKIREFLSDLGIQLVDVNEEAAFLAGRFYRQYKERGGNRSRIIGDFLIAAHAQTFADRLITRDHRFFGGSFPSLKAVAPEDLQ